MHGAGADAPTRRARGAQIACQVDAVILLRALLRALPALSESLAWVETPLLRAVRRGGGLGPRRARGGIACLSACRPGPQPAAADTPPPAPSASAAARQVRANLGRGELSALLAEVEGVLEEEAQARAASGPGRLLGAAPGGQSMHPAAARAFVRLPRWLLPFQGRRLCRCCGRCLQLSPPPLPVRAGGRRARRRARAPGVGGALRGRPFPGHGARHVQPPHGCARARDARALHAYTLWRARAGPPLAARPAW